MRRKGIRRRTPSLPISRATWPMVKNEADFADLEHQWFHDGITDTAYLGACFQIEALLRREIELRVSSHGKMASTSVKSERGMGHR